MNSVRSNNLSLKYQRCTPSGGKSIGIRKSEFVIKTQFLWIKIEHYMKCRGATRSESRISNVTSIILSPSD